MSTVLGHLQTAIRATARSNAKTLKFIADFEDAEGKDLRSRWELWLQIELMRQLEGLKIKSKDLYSEYRAEYKANKNKGAGRAKKGFVSGAIDFAFRPTNGDDRLLAGIELKVKPTPSAAIRGGLHDLLKPRAFKTAGWRFRAIYAMCVYPTDSADATSSKYLDFVKKYGWEPIPFGKNFQMVLIGWETRPRSGDLRDFYAEYDSWVKDLLGKARGEKLTINVRAKKT